MATVGVKGYF